MDNAFMPGEVQYGPAPGFLPPGAALAVLEGNPMGITGHYTIRLKMPDGYKVAPHWHPKRENVTVISGTLKVGMGDKFDESKMMSFATGSFAYLDPSMHHYAMGSGETVVQIHGMAPAKFNYINPNDDPSKKNSNGLAGAGLPRAEGRIVDVLSPTWKLRSEDCHQF